MKDKATLRKLVKDYRPKILRVEVPELEDVWHVRELRGPEWVHVSDQLKEWDEAEQGHAYFASQVVCDDQGTPVFGEDDVPWLAELPGPVLARIWTLAGDLNHMTARAEEGTRKNSLPSGGSSTARPGSAATPAPST